MVIIRLDYQIPAHHKKLQNSLHLQIAFVDCFLFILCAGSREPVLPFCLLSALPEQLPYCWQAQKPTINSFIPFDTYYILCYYNLVFEFLCYPGMGVWAIHPGHMLLKSEYEHTFILKTSQEITLLGHPQTCIRLPTRSGCILL